MIANSGKKSINIALQKQASLRHSLHVKFNFNNPVIIAKSKLKRKILKLFVI